LEYNAAVRLFDRYLEGQLTEVQQKALEDFLEKDERCAAELDRYRCVHELVDRYFGVVRPGEGFLEDVMVGVEEAGAPRRRRRTRPRPEPEEEAGRPSRARWMVFGAVALLVVGVGGFLWFFPRDASLGEVLAVGRGAERQAAGSGEPDPLLEGDRLHAGDRLRATAGELRILLADRSEIAVTPGASLRLGTADGSVEGAHFVEEGVVKFAVLEGAAPTAIGFRDGRASVERFDQGEARFSVEVPSAATQPSVVAVTRGVVRVTNDRASQQVEAGMQSHVRRGAAPSTPVPIRVPRTESRRDRTAARRPPARVPPPTEPRTPNRPAASATPSLDEVVDVLKKASAGESAHLEAMKRLTPAFVGDRARDVAALLADILSVDPNEGVRLEALERLAALAGEDIREAAIDAFQNDDALSVRKRALAEVVKGQDPGEVRVLLLDSLAEPLPEELVPLRIEVLKEIARRAAPEDLDPILGVVETTDDPGVRRNALETLASVKGHDTVDALLPYLRDPDRESRDAAAGALRRLTGKTFGFDASAEEDIREEAIRSWEDWWAENRDTFEF